MTKVLHLVLFLGHPNQPYMTDLFNALKSDNNNLEHSILCSEKLNNDYIDVKYSFLGVKKDVFKIGTILFLIKILFSSSQEFSSIQPLRFVNKFRLLIKWKPLINSEASIIHIHHLHIIPIEILAILKAKDKKIIISLRGKDLVVDTVKPAGKRELLEKLKFISKVHVNSNYFVQLAESKGVERSKIVKTYRGVDENSYNSKNINVLKFKEGQEILKLIVVGRLEWEKGHFFILDTIFRLHNMNIKVQCDFFGEGKFREFLEYRIFQLKLEGIVNLKGHLSNSKLREEYKKYHVALQPSLYESLPNGLLEMCLHNLPCVVSNVGGMSEFIKDGVNGASFNINFPNELDKAILDCSILDKRKVEAYNHSLFEKFSFQKGVQNLNAIYLQMKNNLK